MGIIGEHTGVQGSRGAHRCMGHMNVWGCMNVQGVYGHMEAYENPL